MTELPGQSEVQQRGNRGSGWKLLLHRNFGLMWSAHTISKFGTQTTFFVFPVVALTILGAGPVEMGVLAALETVPFLLFALQAGVWVDRWDRRRTLIITDLGRAVALGAVPAAYFAGVLTMPLLYASAFLLGVMTVFFDIADQAYLPSVVQRDQIADGNKLLEVSRSTADLAGPGLGGLSIRLFTAPFALLVDVASYLLSGLLLWAIRRPTQPEIHEPEPTEPLPMRKEIGEGLRFVFRHPILRAISMSTAISNLFGLGGALSALLTIFALGDLQLSTGVLGLALTIGNAGALLGALASAWLVRTFALGPVLAGSSLVAGAGPVLLAVASPANASVLVALCMAVIASGVAVYNINQVSLRQAITPERLQGRMNASMRFVVWGTLPLGALVGGFLGEQLGVRPVLWMLGPLGATACLPLLLTGQVRRLREIPLDTTS